MSRIRRIHETGHKRKFLVVIDDTPECERALYFAARRAANTGGGLVALSVVPHADFQHWVGVEALMREEAMEEARGVLDSAVDKARLFAEINPEAVIRQGNAAEEIQALIEEDQDIAILVLGAGSGKEGPGPLVSLFANRHVSGFTIPVTVVPGSLSDEEIEALS